MSCILYEDVYGDDPKFNWPRKLTHVPFVSYPLDGRSVNERRVDKHGRKIYLKYPRFEEIMCYTPCPIETEAGCVMYAFCLHSFTRYSYITTHVLIFDVNVYVVYFYLVLT